MCQETKMGAHQPIFRLSIPSRQFNFQLFQREDPITYCRVGEITVQFKVQTFVLL